MSPAQLANGSDAQEPARMVTNGERVKWLPFPSHSKRQQTEMLSFLERDLICCGQQGWLLNKPTSEGILYSSSVTLEGRHYLPVLCPPCSRVPVSPNGGGGGGSPRPDSLAFMSGAPVVVTAAQGNGP